jgi:hypothetical protein
LLDAGGNVNGVEHSRADDFRNTALDCCSQAYGRRSGIPVLLNTSFNVAGEPIVNAALEGYSTFRRCGIDALVAGPAVVTKRATASAKREHVA